MRFLLLTTVFWCAAALAPQPNEALRNEAWSAAGITPSQGRQSAVGFARWPTEKTPGTIRIGLFGPSIAAPAEVAPHEDVGTFLQQELEANGYEDVEVLSFGVGAAAIQQSYLIWDRLGRPYGLDHVVLMVPWAMEQRELAYRSLRRNRFVREGSSWRELKASEPGPLGLWESLRYDLFPPALKGWVKGNPFYHHARPKEEAAEVGWHAILRFHKDMPKLSLYFPYQPPEKFEERAKSADLPAFRSSLMPLAKAYWASPSHLNAAGNRLRAREIFAYLTGKDTYSEEKAAKIYPVLGRYLWPLTLPTTNAVVSR